MPVARHLPRPVKKYARVLLHRLNVNGRVLDDLVPGRTTATRATTKPAPKPAAKKPAAKKPAGPPHLLREVAMGREVPRSALRSEVVVELTRELLAENDLGFAISAAEGLRRRDDTRVLGSLAAAIVAYHRGYREAAWAYLREVPADLWSRHAMAEYVVSGYAQDPQTVQRELAALADSPSPQVTPQGWFEATSRAFGHEDSDLARSLYARFETATDTAVAPDKLLEQHRDWLRDWVAADPDSPSAPAVPDGHVSFAVMDYGHPGRNRASANIGDHVQSVASLGHLARRQGLRYHGEEELVDLLQRFTDRVPESLRVHNEQADVDLITVDRDASMYAAIPPNTWTLGFGWFMHPIYEMRCGFPFHENLLPIFLSFHCSKRELLTAEAIAYLKMYAPIGCRDWTTVDILLSIGIPAFFSGCLTTTTSTVFPALTEEERPGPDAPVAYVDAAAELVPAGGKVFKHSDDRIRFRSFVRNVNDAVDLLETYRRNYSKVVTSRLHAYLPNRSLGMAVDFVPKNPSDPRFEGLLGISDEAFEAIRTGILDKLDRIFAAILSGADADTVYALWRELTADEVAFARTRHSAPAPAVPLDPQVRDEVAARALTGAGPADGLELVVHVGASNPGRLEQGLVRLAKSAAAKASRPVRLTLVSRAAEAPGDDWLGEQLPGLTVRVLHTAGLGDSLRQPDGKPIPGRTLDLALLPDLLPDVDRVAVLPMDTVVLDDPAELYDLDLGGRRIGAPTTEGVRGASGFGLIHTAANALRERTALAAELRRVAHSRHVFDFDSLITDVLVLDLAGLRADGFVGEFAGYLPAYGLGLRELLCLYAGPDRAQVPPAWHVVPSRGPLDNPKLLHWVDPIKPWWQRQVPGDEYWRDTVAA